MNKTVKTIAWICLVLGLLGVAVEVGVYVRGRALVAQFQESVESGEFPMFKSLFADGDKDGDIDDEDWDKDSFDRSGRFALGGMMDIRRGFEIFSNNRGWLSGMHDGSFRRIGLVFPLLLLAGGPVLTVVGAVMLIVNRTPKVIVESKDKKEKSKKK
jgi:hypothetical protein